MEPRKIVLEFSENAHTWLADRGYDPMYGARPVKRVIQTEVLHKISKLLIEGTVVDGDGLLGTLNEEKDTLEFQVEPGKGRKFYGIVEEDA